ncbi:hypothetical protein I6N90_13805 [Paenibacillus sp. GSMTC-2017]|uniref:hypothetical protein n=1 Tax=Paenibacillus sp. GSMTC-2017 TaxID=2794350 RepID=UPI0018D80C8B|nr:hypothetical protein [Paenibacillus sp. GSMTC-2017]MBH5318875.1 hypothetical protein [Paenibacillus sp. GSMTC-2017]
MSMPNVPNITPIITLEREKVINLLLTSIALEEIGLSHLLNAEAEKIQSVLKHKDFCLGDALLVNESVERMLRNIIKNQMLLQFKLEDVIRLDHKHDHHFEE